MTMGRTAANVGDPVAAIDTPALVIDLDAMERNLATMAGFARAQRIALRPHAKMHKCAAIARLQMQAGAVGVCVQKLGEAEALAAAGVPDIYISNEIVDAAKLARLATLAGRVKLAVAVDSALGVERLAQALIAAGSSVDVYVEIDVGQGRCGVAPAAAGALAHQVVAHGLRFAGLQAYHGRAQHLREPSERERAIAHAQRIVTECVAALAADGVAIARITGAGTGTYPLEAASGIWNELQPGSYIFMDADYGRNRLETSALRFRQSLYVLSTVISVAGGRLIVDAGLKAYAVDSGLPQVPDAPGWLFAKASDEHGVLTPASSAPPLPIAVGLKLKLIPGHCDPTVNLHDWFIGVRGGVVETLWPITARGAIF